MRISLESRVVTPAWYPMHPIWSPLLTTPHQRLGTHSTTLLGTMPPVQPNNCATIHIPGCQMPPLPPLNFVALHLKEIFIAKRSGKLLVWDDWRDNVPRGHLLESRCLQTHQTRETPSDWIAERSKWLECPK